MIGLIKVLLKCGCWAQRWAVIKHHFGWNNIPKAKLTPEEQAKCDKEAKEIIDSLKMKQVKEKEE